jgi:hypothetical protein
MVVVEYAKSGRSTCHTCNHLIEKDTLRIGTTVSNDGYINIEWHHEDCFWDKRAKKYYYRKNKRINTVLKAEQFTGLNTLDTEVISTFEEKIRQANLKWASEVALAKHGIVVDEVEEEEEKGETPQASHEAAPVAEPADDTAAAAKGKGKGRKRKKAA